MSTRRTADRTSPYWQYCSIAAAYRAGPIDYIGKIFRDGQLIANLDYTFEPDEQWKQFTINPSLASGRAWYAIVHRGSNDDVIISDNLRDKTGQDHNTYPGTAWIEWLNIDLGQGSTALPSLAAEMGVHAPAIDDYEGGESHPYGVNPFAAIYALLKAATGGDFDADLLDASHWGAQATLLESVGIGNRTGNLVKCHPTFTAGTTLGDAISQILSYVDGYIYAREGKACVGWFPNQTADLSGVTEISEADLESKPSGGGFPDWNEGATSVVVVFKSYDRDYGEDVARYNAPANRENNISADPARKERPFIHGSDQANMIATEGTSESSSGEISTNLTVFKSRAVNEDDSPMMPGDLMNWDYGPHSLDLACRVVSRRMRMGMASDILTVTRERGAYPRPYVAAVDAAVPASDEPPDEIDASDVRLWFLPPGFGGGRQVSALINRAALSVRGVKLHMSADGSDPWEMILDQRFFAAKCAVTNGGIDDNDTTVRVISTSVDFPRFASQSTLAQKNDTLVLLLGDELVSVGSVTVVSANTYDLTISRARQGSTAAAHADTVTCWLFSRNEVQSVIHREFYNVRTSGVYDADLAAKYFKTQPRTRTQEADAKPDAGIALVLPDLTAADAAGGIRTFYQANAPVGYLQVGDIWFETDNKNKQYRWDGSSWVAVDDTRISETITALASTDALIASVDALLTTTIADVTANAAAITAEVLARGAAIISEASSRSTGDSTLTTALNAHVATYNTHVALVATQITALAAADSATASQITVIQSDVSTAFSQIASESSTRASADSAHTSDISSLTATVGSINASVAILAAAYIVGGVAVATWGFKLDGGGKVVGMQAIAASGGTQAETGVIVFSGADLQSDNYVAGTSGWKMSYTGDVEFGNGSFRGIVNMGFMSKVRAFGGALPGGPSSLGRSERRLGR